MTYFVTQYGNHFFVIRRVNGYTGNMIFNGTKISESEYKKLFYSGGKRVVKKNILTDRFDEVRIEGNASEILGRNVCGVGGECQ